MKTKRCFSKILPFDQWKAQTNPTEGQIQLYHLIVEGLKSIAQKAAVKQSNKRTHHGRS